MRKDLLFVIFIISLCLLTGCGKGVKTEDGKTAYTCVKRGIDDSSSISGDSWKEDITFTAKLDDNNKLSYYSSLNHYTYNTKDSCDNWCDIKVKWNDEINENNYSGGRRVTTCNCDKLELIEEYIYDDIPNLDSILRSDIRELNSDNTFRLDEWMEQKQKYGYNCG